MNITVRRSWKTSLLGALLILAGSFILFLAIYTGQMNVGGIIAMFSAGTLLLIGIYILLEALSFRLILSEDMSVRTRSLFKKEQVYPEEELRHYFTVPRRNEKKLLVFEEVTENHMVASVDEDSVNFREACDLMERVKEERHRILLETHLNLAIMQILPAADRAQNRDKGLQAVRNAKAAGADIALFPEMWSNGYSLQKPLEELKKEAVKKDSEFLQAYRDLAEELEIAVGITFLEACPEGIKNSLILYDRFGREQLHYSKVHTCDFGDEYVLARGDHFETCTLDTAKGDVRIGAMICYDREFPESARILMLQGAELILVPNACPMEQNRLEQLRARAFENMTAVAVCNYPKGQPDCNGHSSVFDGIAWKPDDAGSRDMKRLEASEKPGVYMAHIDLEELRDYRQREAFGNAFRRPSLYHVLTDTEIREPFIRSARRADTD